MEILDLRAGLSSNQSAPRRQKFSRALQREPEQFRKTKFRRAPHRAPRDANV
jgi:hypothetical protein